MSQLSKTELAKSLCASQKKSSVKELRELAKELRVDKYSTLSKEKLCLVIGKQLQEQIKSIKESEVEIPNGFLDPITQDIMYDPYMLSDGTSMSKTSIDRMFASKTPPRGPETKQLLDKNFLVPNINLRKAILEWIIENGREETVSEEEEDEKKERNDESKRNEERHRVSYEETRQLRAEEKANRRVENIQNIQKRKEIQQENHLTAAQKQAMPKFVEELAKKLLLFTNQRQFERFWEIRDLNSYWFKDVVLLYNPGSHVAWLMSAYSGEILNELHSTRNNSKIKVVVHSNYAPNRLPVNVGEITIKTLLHIIESSAYAYPAA
jgi:hypothetical protein